MPRPQTIYVDTDAVLRGIATAIVRLEAIEAKGFAGRNLTHQQALRRLEADGLVAIAGVRARRVRLTDAALARTQTNATPD